MTPTTPPDHAAAIELAPGLESELEELDAIIWDRLEEKLAHA